MRYLPDLDYLNGLPVERDALDETNESQNGIEHAVLEESEMNGAARVTERPGEEDDEDNEPDNNMTAGAHNTSLLSAQSVTRNANILAQHLDTEELE